ncbi:hypothetical protein QIS74_03097 [Colletotrichum tabaci]|uniref:Transposon Tf2-6 polyprotein n=1 Tax=Colletotrichum tabaci TaxID=1209068 RepID=A0AAV9TL15_9PEZI
MDTCSQVDLISSRLVQRLGLKPAEANAPVLESFCGKTSKPGRAYWLTFFLLDSQGHPRKLRRLFAEAPRPKEAADLLLARHSMGQEGIIIDTASNTWSYERISVAEPAAFAQEVIENGQRAYVLYISGDGKVTVDAVRSPKADEVVLPPELSDMADVFDEGAAKSLNELDGAEHAIDLLPGTKPPFGSLYPLGEKQLEELRTYLEEMKSQGRIQPSVSEAGAPVLFVPKKDGSLRLCVDYRGLNKVTIKNRYPLPLIGELLDRLSGAKFVSKIDLKEAYHRIRIKKEDRWKTAFRTRYGHFEYTVMPFGLTNAPATFQAYIHRALAELLDSCCIAYLDDIMIYSQTREQHTKDLRKVLRRLRQFGLYAKLSKCEFYKEEIEFLGYVITRNGVKMEQSRVQAIAEWSTPTSIKDLQVFLGFCNFYRKFIAKYSAIVAPMTELLKGTDKKSIFTWSEAAGKAFNHLKQAFCSATILTHWNPLKLTKVETDASTRAVGAILSQMTEGQWRPVAYWSRKLSDTEQRWHTGQQELLAIVEGLEHWAHYLQGLSDKFLVLTDHQALKGVVGAPARDLRGRLARWVYKLSAFDFDLEHRPGKTNPADGLSRRPDYMEGDVPYADVLPTLAQKLNLVDELPEEMRRQIAQMENSNKVVRAYVNAVQASLRIPDGDKKAKSVDRGSSPLYWWRTTGRTNGRATIAAVMTRGQRARESTADARRQQSEDAGESDGAGIVVPEQHIPRLVMRQLVTGETAFSNQPLGALEDTVRGLQAKDEFCQTQAARVRGAAGSGKSYTLDRRGTLFFKGRLVIPEVPTLQTEILRRHHDDPRSGHMGTAKTLELVTRKFHWENIGKSVQDYVRSCQACQGVRTPRHKPYGQLQPLPMPAHPFQEISMDFITGLPPSLRGDGVEHDCILVILAQLIYKRIECRFGTPEGIVSDRDKLFTSKFWEEFTRERAIKRRLSTAHHPQTDGQTERVHQTLEKYLRIYADGSSGRWAVQLDEAEFAYNNSRHATIGTSPMMALYGYHPRWIEYVPTSNRITVAGVEERIRHTKAVRDRAVQQWQVATESQAKYYNQKHQPKEYRRGEIVGLSTRNFRFKNRKLAPRFIRVAIAERIGTQAYRVHLPEQYRRMHDVFSVSLLEPWAARRRDDESPANLPELEEDPDEWEVEEVVAHQGHGDDQKYLVKWVGWPVEYNTWEPLHHLKNAREKVQSYNRHAQKAHRKWDDT